MIKSLKLNNVGHFTGIDLEFSDKLNLISSDSGLGKSFLLDIIWWAHSHTWPAEVNSKVSSGLVAFPGTSGKTSIDFTFGEGVTEKSCECHYNRRAQSWLEYTTMPVNTGLVVYAMSDGGFSVWDPIRNFLGSKNTQKRVPAFVFSPQEVLNGLRGCDGVWHCNGLIHDWAGWYREKGECLENLSRVLKVLSGYALDVSNLTRVTLDDVRDIPTVNMPFKKNVAVVYLPASARVILSLAYILVWSIMEHRLAAKIINEEVTDKITLIIDDVEAHLNAQDQRNIISRLLSVMDIFGMDLKVQLIASTKSYLVKSSTIQEIGCAWHDLSSNNGVVEVNGVID